jgi:hypothetical protein
MSGRVPFGTIRRGVLFFYVSISTHEVEGGGGGGARAMVD